MISADTLVLAALVTGRTCRQCGRTAAMCRTPTSDGVSFVVTTRCGCTVYTYREDLAARVQEKSE